MEALVPFLFIASSFCIVHGRTGIHHHNHLHHRDTNRSIAVPPVASFPDDDPDLPPALPPNSPENSPNSTSIPPSHIAPPPTISPKNGGSSSNSTSIPPSPSPIAPPPTPKHGGSSSNSTSIPPSPSPIAPPPTPKHGGSSSNSTSNPLPLSPVAPPPTPKHGGSSSNSTSNPPSPSPVAPPPTISPKHGGSSSNSTSNPPALSPVSTSNPPSLSPAPPPTISPKHGGSSSNSTSIPPSPSPVAPPPPPKNGGSSSNSTSNPPSPSPVAPPPTISPKHGGSSSNSTSIPPSPSHIAPPTESPKHGGNSTNSTSIPPLPSPSPAPSPANGISTTSPIVVFNVRSLGAVGDGVSDDTEAFKSAWDSACQSGSAAILAPRGYKFMIRTTIFAGPCQEGVVFQVDGVVMPPDGPGSWLASNSKRNWLVFYRADGLTMQGSGLIDGRGEKWWDLPCKPHKGINGTTSPGPCDSPVALRFFQSSNLSVHGLRIQNSPQFHFRFDNCRNVTIDSISISSPALSPNTDGIHVENTNTVGIYNSVISNGDDCISIGAGSLNVDIRNVTCGPSHGISIGSLGKQNSHACVTNITVRNSVIKQSDNGVRIKTWQGGSGSVSSITFENIKMDAVRNPIILDQYYCLSKPCANKTANIFISDISYSGIKGTYDVRSPPIHLGCSDSVPCTNVTFTDVELLPAQGFLVSDPFCWNVYGASQTLTIPPVACLLEGLPKSIMDYDAEKCY